MPGRIIVSTPYGRNELFFKKPTKDRWQKFHVMYVDDPDILDKTIVPWNDSTMKS
jgi:hypothetical protein